MSSRKERFREGDIHHIYCRAINGALAYRDEDDYQYFIDAMYIANTVGSGFSGYTVKEKMKMLSEGLVKVENQSVNILGFTLVQNHFHILLEVRSEKDTSDFIQRLSLSYTMYIKQKYIHKGRLWGSVVKNRKVDKENHYNIVPHYINLNVLDAVSPGWKENKIRNKPAMLKELSKYKWSTAGDFISNNNRYSYLFNKNKALKIFNSGSISEYLERLSSVYMSAGMSD